MEEYPKTLAELEREFATEEACAHYLFQLRWPEGFVCPRCGGTQCWTTKRALFNCARCQYQLSVKAGDPFCGIALVSGDVVSGDLVGHQPEERSQRERAATPLGAGQL